MLYEVITNPLRALAFLRKVLNATMLDDVLLGNPSREGFEV